MSQHDLVIDNGPGLSVRTDIVAALQALASISSGPLEPTTMYAGMFWLDTSVTPNGAIRMRDLANTAWTFPSLYGDDRVGEIAIFAFGTPPPGWLKANGAAVSRTTYAALFLKIGTQFGIGDGTSTFGLPDLRGQFLRIWDDGRGVDAARAFGSTQADSVAPHGHTATTSLVAGGSHAHGGTANSAGAHDHTVTDFFVGAGTSIQGAAANLGNVSATRTTSTDGAHTHTITTDTEPAHSHTATTTVANNTGTTETRPKNVALLACIRYA